MNGYQHGYTPAGIPLDDLDAGRRYELEMFAGPDIAGEFLYMEVARGHLPGGRPMLYLVFRLSGGRQKKIARGMISEIKHGQS